MLREFTGKLTSMRFPIVLPRDKVWIASGAESRAGAPNYYIILTQNKLIDFSWQGQEYSEPDKAPRGQKLRRS